MKDKVEVIKDHAGLKTIKINDLIHLDFTTSQIRAIHSYIDEKNNPKFYTDVGQSKYYKMYYINFHLDSGQMVYCEYNDRELWETILKGLE